MHHDFAIVRVTECESTQALVGQLLGGGVRVAVASADHQTAGRGREDRSWVDDGCGGVLLMSVGWQGKQEVEVLAGLPERCAEAIAKACDGMYGVRLHVQLPNDLVWNEAKVGGVLIDTRCSGNHVHQIIVGVGLNVSHAPCIPGRATGCLEGIAGQVVVRDVLEQAVAHELVACIIGGGEP